MLLYTLNIPLEKLVVQQEMSVKTNPFAWLWLGQPFQWALSQRKGALVKNSALTGEQGANWDTVPFLFPLFVSVVDNRAQPYKS